VLAFTLESHDGDGFLTGEGRRYARGARYVRASLEAASLAVLQLDRQSIRTSAACPCRASWSSPRNREWFLGTLVEHELDAPGAVANIRRLHLAPARKQGPPWFFVPRFFRKAGPRSRLRQQGIAGMGDVKTRNVTELRMRKFAHQIGAAGESGAVADSFFENYSCNQSYEEVFEDAFNGKYLVDLIEAVWFTSPRRGEVDAHRQMRGG
jgi:hypothetical protein